MARVAISEVVTRVGVTDSALRAVNGATVQVNHRDAGPATVYAESTGGATLTNPVTTVHGRIPGWVDPGPYDLVISGSGIDSETVPFEAFTAGSASSYFVDWAPSTRYFVGQPVVQGSQTFIAVDEHVSGATFAGDLVAGHWKVMPVALGNDVQVPRATTIAATGTQHIWSSAAISNGTAVAENSVTSRKILLAASQLQIEFGNHHAFGRLAAPNAIRITAAVALSKTGPRTPVYFSGSQSVVIPADGSVECDPIGLSVTEGDRLWLWIFVQPWDAVAGAPLAGGKWPTYYGARTVHDEAIEVVNSGPVDKTLSGTITHNGNTCYGPVAIRALDAARTKRVHAFTGDSITEGAGAGYYTYGYPYLAAEDSPMFVLGYYGESVGGIIATPSTFSTRLRYALEADVIGSLYGTNDVEGGASLATLQANLIAHWRQLGTRGALVWQGTLLPRNSSTDTWATLVNQTPHANEAVRVALNQWLRAGAPLNPTTLAAVAIGTAGALLAGQSGHPLWTVLDVASSVESSQDSGKWTVNAAGRTPLTVDGTHPSTWGYELMAAYLAPRLGLSLTTPPATVAPAVAGSTFDAAVLAKNPSGFWRFDESAHDMALDRRAKHGGRIVGSFSRIAGATTDSDGAISLDAGYVAIPDHPDFRRHAGFTLLRWFRSPSFAAARPLMGRRGTGADWSWFVQSGLQQFTMTGLGGAGGFFEGNPAMSVDTWYLLAFTYAANGDAAFYRNGVLQSFLNGVSNLTPPSGVLDALSEPLLIGSTDGTAGPVQLLDDAAFYPAVLSQAELAAIYAAR